MFVVVVADGINCATLLLPGARLFFYSEIKTNGRLFFSNGCCVINDDFLVSFLFVIS